MTYDIVLMAALAASLLLNLIQLSSSSNTRRVLQDSIDDAEKKQSGWARIPVNTLLKLGYSSRHGLYTKEQPHRDPKEFNRKPGPHPAALRAPQRHNL